MSARIWLMAILGLSSAFSNASQVSALELQTQGCFSIWVPPGFVIKQEQGPDFDLYRVMKGEVQYVGIYSGFAPGFPFDRSDPALEETRMETPGVFVVSRWDGDRLVDREMLITVQPEGGPGAFLHVWTAVSDPADLRLAEKITSTIVAPANVPGCR